MRLIAPDQRNYLGSGSAISDQILNSMGTVHPRTLLELSWVKRSGMWCSLGVKCAGCCSVERGSQCLEPAADVAPEGKCLPGSDAPATGRCPAAKPVRKDYLKQRPGAPCQCDRCAHRFWLPAWDCGISSSTDVPYLVCHTSPLGRRDPDSWQATFCPVPS